ncbi:MAG: hypothetical protein BWK76_23680 [Desulfobulbaceae bacterium A2]|nr:MAG: hypothetical protein BWK76_23680 [Desulfobulbaceae bacterium A2]
MAENTTGAAAVAAPVPQLHLPPHTLLLAFHGTEGARRAIDLALVLAEAKVTHIVHLLVVPDFWDGMQGDDWLNNSSTRDTFARHLENMLDQDSRALIQEVQASCSEHGLTCEAVLRYGDPAECLLEAVAKQAVELVVIGPPRPKGTQGLRSRMNMDKLARGLNVPLLVAGGS